MSSRLVCAFPIIEHATADITATILLDPLTKTFTWVPPFCYIYIKRERPAPGKALRIELHAAIVMSTPASADVTSSVSKLSLETSDLKKPTKAKSNKKEKVVDSWEDEDVSSDTETEADVKSAHPDGHPEGTAAPPPTPISPTYNRTSQPTVPSSSGGYHIASDAPLSPTARPEKTDAVARRMIAGALGLRAPKQTEEQKAYDKAIREKERKRREEEKAAEAKKQEEAAKARAAIWED